MPSDRDQISNKTVVAILGGVATAVGVVLFFVFSSWVSHVNNALANNGKDLASIDRRVVTVESSLSFIAAGISRIEAGNEKTSDTLQKIRDEQRDMKQRIEQYHSGDTR